MHPDAATSAPILNVGGITTVLAAVLTVVVLTVAIRAALRAHRSDTAGVLTALGIVALGAMIWALASGNYVSTLGNDLIKAALHL